MISFIYVITKSRHYAHFIDEIMEMQKFLFVRGEKGAIPTHFNSITYLVVVWEILSDLPFSM